MTYLSRSYLTEEEDNLYERDSVRKEKEEKKLALQRRQEEIPESVYLKRDLLDRIVDMCSEEENDKSIIGTKEYWENLYDEELKNFNDFGDEVEIWFGKDILSKLVDTVCQVVPERETTTIVNIGTGNGHVIQRLLTRGYVHLTGIDYSEKSIELARALLGLQIPFHIIDMTDCDSSSSSLARYDIGIDKDTRDAILLCSSDQRKSKRDAYVDTVHRHIKHLLFLVSCNWTRNELLTFFEPSRVLSK